MKISKLEIKKALWQDYAKRSAWAFCLLYDYDFFSQRPFLHTVADTIQILVDKNNTPKEIFERLKKSTFVKKFNKKAQKATISMPPRAGKSYTTSVTLAWVLGKYPHGSIMRNTCTATLYEKMSYDVREILLSPVFKFVFPDIKLSDKKANLKGWNTNKAKQVSYFGAGVGGTIIGFGADLLAITDDLYKDLKDALSPTIDKKIKAWAGGTHETRKEKGCAELDIGTRWSKNDYIGKKIKLKEYDIIITIPALINGKSFCNNVISTKEYLKRKSKLDKFIWQAAYMQQPIDLEGVLFPEHELKWFKINELNKDIDKKAIAAIDTADGGTDFYAMIIGYIIKDYIYIIDVIFNHEKIETNEIYTTTKIKQHKILNVIVETNKEGSLYVSTLRKHTKSTIYGQFQTHNKIERIIYYAGLIKKYFRFREDFKEGSEYEKFLDNLMSFSVAGNNENDDAPDATALLAQYLVKLNIIKI